jgi:hypothetical protein
MADTKISALPEVTTPDSSDVLPIVSGGATRKITVQNLAVQGLPGPAGPKGPGMVWHGSYNAGHDYNVGDGVGYLGSSYICKLASTGNLPTNGTYWDPIVLKGDPGDPGTPGADGVDYTPETPLLEEHGGTGETTFAAGDLLVGEAGGGLQRLTKGADGEILKTVAGVLAWDTLPSGESGGSGPHDLLSATHEDTAPDAVQRGDLIAGIGITPAWGRLPKGTLGQILKMGAEEPGWDALPSGESTGPHALLSASHPDTTPAGPTRGDVLVARGVSPTWSVLAKGASGKILTMGADEPDWNDPAPGGVASVSGTPHQVLASGDASNVLLGTPQDIDTDSDVQFASAGLGIAPEAGSALKVAGHGYFVPYDAGSGGAALEIDWRDGTAQTVLLTATCTFTFSNPKAGGRYALRLKQDAGAPFGAVWPGNVVWSGGIEPTLAQVAGGLDLIAFYYDGTDYIGAGANSAAAAQGMPEIPLAVPHGGTGLFGVTEGDLLVGASGNAIAKLAAPTTGDVLTGDTTVAGKVKWAPPVDASRVWCAVFMGSDTVSNSGVELPIVFDSEVSDDAGMHDNGVNPERVTIPVGADGVYVISAGIGWGTCGNAVGVLWTRLYKNGTLTFQTTNPPLWVFDANAVTTWVMSLAAGDYLELRGFQYMPLTVAVQGGQYKTFLRMVQVI